MATSVKLEGIEEDRFYTVKQVARILGVTTRTIHNWKTNRIIKTFKFGGQVRIQGLDIINMLRNGEVVPK